MVRRVARATVSSGGGACTLGLPDSISILDDVDDPAFIDDEVYRAQRDAQRFVCVYVLSYSQRNSPDETYH